MLSRQVLYRCYFWHLVEQIQHRLPWVRHCCCSKSWNPSVRCSLWCWGTLQGFLHFESRSHLTDGLIGSNKSLSHWVSRAYTILPYVVWNLRSLRATCECWAIDISFFQVSEDSVWSACSCFRNPIPFYCCASNVLVRPSHLSFSCTLYTPS